MGSTLLLDRGLWDLVLDAYGNVAVAAEPYSLAQDAASAIRTFNGEVYYNTTLGVQYFGPILGQRPPLSLMKADFVELGPDNPDFRQFRHRVERSLAKMQAEKPKPAAAEAGQLKESRSAPPQ